jgi:surface protein
MIEDMNHVLSRNDIMNEPIECWDIGNVTNMHAMFGAATSFNQPLDRWDTSKVTNMESIVMKFNKLGSFY